MGLLQAVILGLVQGLTEFIPVSSSGHLVLIRGLFDWEDTGIAFDAFLHLGTLVAVLIYFWSIWKSLLSSLGLLVAGVFHRSLWKRLESADLCLLLALFLGTVPALLAGYFLRGVIDGVFRDTVLVAPFLISTGLLFIVVERGRRFFQKGSVVTQGKFGSTQFEDLSWRQSLLIGLMQAISVLPGISRSGFTIAGGIFTGLTREAAARFAFLLSGPVVLAAGILSMMDLANRGMSEIGFPSVAVGFIVSLVSGYLAMHLMLRYLRTRKLYLFAIYLIVLGVVILFINAV